MKSTIDNSIPEGWSPNKMKESSVLQPEKVSKKIERFGKVVS